MTAGFIVLDKPAGLTSRDAVDHAQKWFPREKLGHAGTLDPAATGVLVIGVGAAATRLIEYVQQQDKVYRSTFTLGAISTTDDGDGALTALEVTHPPGHDAVQSALQRFVGTIEQTPPVYSAARVQGQRAYSKARRGEAVHLAPRLVTVHDIELLRYEYPDIDVEVTCGKGTYLRSLARDLGSTLKTGGYVSLLRRIRIGGFTLEQAVPWDATGEEAERLMQPLIQAVPTLPRVVVSEEELARLRKGQWLRGDRADLAAGDIVFVAGKALVGLGEYDSVQQVIRPSKMLQASGGCSPPEVFA